MFIPVATDAPLYHRPWATVSLIAVNTLVFVQHGLGGLFGNCGCEGWMLDYGGGLHPLQWITFNFVHFSPLHLVGNMIFLWAFGMVVEGKIGWWRFLLLYLGIGIAGGFLIQMRTFNYDGLVTGAGGASLVVYGLIAIALIWAPENEVDVVFCFIPMFMMGPRGTGVLQVRIYSLALWYLVMELIFWWFTSRSVHTPYAAPINSELAHLLGAVLGAGAGIVMLKKGWVDCENWDLFSVWKGEHRKECEFVPFYQRHTAPADAEENDADSQASGVERIQSELAAGRPLEAYWEYQRMQERSNSPPLPRPLLKALADALYRRRAWDKALPVMLEYHEQFPAGADRLRVRLASLLVKTRHRPRRALRILEEVNPARLNRQYEQERQRVTAVANRMIQEGVLELQQQ